MVQKIEDCDYKEVTLESISNRVVRATLGLIKHYMECSNCRKKFGDVTEEERRILVMEAARLQVINKATGVIDEVVMK